MRVDYRDRSDPKERKPRGAVYRLDTGEKITSCFYFDTETGEYGEHVLDSEGRYQRDPARPSRPLVRFGRAPLRFEQTGWHWADEELREAGERLRRETWPGWLKWLGHKLGLRRWCPACRRMTWWHWTGYCPHAGAGAGGGTP
jgi:hypothetical protein